MQRVAFIDLDTAEQVGEGTWRPPVGHHVEQWCAEHGYTVASSHFEVDRYIVLVEPVGR